MNGIREPTTEQREEAWKIVEELEILPSVMKQAAAYINTVTGEVSLGFTTISVSPASFMQIRQVVLQSVPINCYERNKGPLSKVSRSSCRATITAQQCIVPESRLY